MILYTAICFSIVALSLLVIWPVAGIVLLFISKPIIDTTFAQPLLHEFRLTEIVGALVPILVFGCMLVAHPEQSLRRMPLKGIWIIYTAEVFFFSSFILYNEGLVAGANVFFRHINGFVGFYMLQAFFYDHQAKRLRILLLGLIIASLFPMGIGVYQLMTGKVWIAAQVEGITRYVGLYHDAFTVRYYAFQTILALVLYGALYARRNLFLKAGALAYGVVSTAVMIGAYSKTGVVSMMLWVTSWTVLQRKFVTFLLLGSCAGLIGVYYASDITANIVQLFHKEIGHLEGEVELERTFQGRWYGWKEMMSRWENFHWLRKVFGSGEVAFGAHNDYLQMLFHGGIFGLLIYLSLLITIGFRIASDLRRKVDPMGVSALMLFLMWMVDMIGLVPSSYPGYQWFVWGMIGLSLRLREEEGRAREQANRVKQAVPSDNRLEAPSALALSRRYTSLLP
jgi:hypothetical protein